MKVARRVHTLLPLWSHAVWCSIRFAKFGLHNQIQLSFVNASGAGLQLKDLETSGDWLWGRGSLADSGLDSE